MPPPAVPLLADPGGGVAAGSPRPSPSQMAWAASTGGPVPRQIGASCLQSAWEGLHPCHGSETRAKPGSSHGVGVQSGGGHRRQLKVPMLLCLVLDLAKILNQGCGQATGRMCQWRVGTQGPLSWPQRGELGQSIR